MKALITLLLMFGFYVDVTRNQSTSSTEAGSRSESNYGYSHGQGI